MVRRERRHVWSAEPGSSGNIGRGMNSAAKPPIRSREVAAADVAEVIDVLASGGLVVIPTERWYMVCCDAGNAAACARVYAAKRRPAEKQLLLVLPRGYVLDEHFRVGPSASALAEHLWPGDVSLLLPWRDPAEGSRYASVGGHVALVGQPEGFLGMLADRYPGLLAASSANISGLPGLNGTEPAITAAEVHAFAAGAEAPIDLLIDGGICPLATHMTIVDCGIPDAPPVITREGTVHRRAIAAALLSRGLTL